MHITSREDMRILAGELELRITRAGTVGAVIRFSGRKRGIPTRRDLCLPPGGEPGRC